MVYKHGKIRFSSKIQAEQAQSALFDAGYTWEDGSQKYKAELYAIHWASECMKIWAISAQVYKYAGVERESIFQPVFQAKTKVKHHKITQYEEVKNILKEAEKYLRVNGLSYLKVGKGVYSEQGKQQRYEFMAGLSFIVQAVKGKNLSPTCQIEFCRKIGIQIDSKKYYQMSIDWTEYRPKGHAFEQNTLIENFKYLQNVQQSNSSR